MKKFLSGKIGTLLLLVVVGTSAYFINVEVQSYLGRQAFAETGLVSIPFSEAVGKAKAENKLVLVDISAIWCSNCRRLDQTVFSDEGVKSVLANDFIFTRLEYESEEGQAFLEKNNAGGFPTLWLVDGEGNTLRRFPVTYDPARFAGDLKAAASAQ